MILSSFYSKISGCKNTLFSYTQLIGEYFFFNTVDHGLDTTFFFVLLRPEFIQNYLMFRIEIDSKRIFGLDLLRAIAIICVVHVHISFLLENTPLEFLTNIPWPHGVEMFFVLSGFLIGKSLISNAHSHDGILDKTQVLSFYKRVMMRILPNYYAILLVHYILVRIQFISGDIHAFPMWQFATFTQNLFTPFYGFYWESWSLSVQWWFYILFPMMLWGLGRWIHPKISVPFLYLTFLLLAIIYRMTVCCNAGDHFWWGVWLEKTVASRLDAVFTGVLVSWVYHYYQEQWNKYAVASFMAGIALMVMVSVIPRHIGTFYYNILYLTLGPTAIALWIPLFYRYKRGKTPLKGMVAHLSVLSYSIFLTNLLVAYIIVAQCPETFRNMGAWGYIVCWIWILAVSYILYIVVERPFMKLRARV